MATRKISREATDVHCLLGHNNKLCKINFKNDEENRELTDVEAFPTKVAIVKFYNFLRNLGRKCILTAHNLTFDCPRILSLIEKMEMLNHFQTVVAEFFDTLPLARKITKKQGKGSNELKSLPQHFGISDNNSYDTLGDVEMLQKNIRTYLA